MTLAIEIPMTHNGQSYQAVRGDLFIRTGDDYKDAQIRDIFKQAERQAYRVLTGESK